MSETNNEATQSDESNVTDFDFDALADEVLGIEPETATQESNETTEELESDDHTRTRTLMKLMKQRMIT